MDPSVASSLKEDFEWASPLGQALKASGMDLDSAAFYMKRANIFGQVGFASGEKNKERLMDLTAARRALLESLEKNASPAVMNDAILRSMIPHTEKDLHKVGMDWVLNTAAKKAAATQWSTQDDFHLKHVCKLADLSRDEMIEFLVGGINSAPPMDKWERVDSLAGFRAGDPPSIVDGSHEPDRGTWCLEPEKIEAALSAKAGSLMERFGLGNIRISGFPSMERSDATLDSLEIALGQLARAAGVPEKAIGLGGGFCIHVNADVGRASGYNSRDINAICLSPDNGWRTLAHEWFHAFDGSVPILAPSVKDYASISGAEKLAKQGKLSAGENDHANTSEKSWASERNLAYGKNPFGRGQKQALARSAAALIKSIRSSPGQDALSAVALEEDEASVKRVQEGLYERFYMNRVTPGLEERAAASFKSLFARVLAGNAGLPEISSWRKEHLGERAGLSLHYDAFIVAEKTARDSRVSARAMPEKDSAMERFAQIADKHLSEATGDDYWTGYSNSATEMSARGFEGNCFLDTPDKLRHYLVDGRDNSMYWPVGAERGAHKENYRAYLARGVMAMIGAGTLPVEVLDGFEAASGQSKPSAAPGATSEDKAQAALAQVGQKIAAHRKLANDGAQAAKPACAKLG